MSGHSQEAGYKHPLFEVFAAVATIFGVYSEYDRLGITGITIGCVLFSALWFTSAHAEPARADVRKSWMFFRSGAIKGGRQFCRAACALVFCLPFRQWRHWWILYLPALALAVGWIGVLTGYVHTTIGRKNYLDSFATIEAHDAQHVLTKYPGSDPSREARMNIWKRWMADGADTVGPVYEIDTPDFTDCYRDLTATYSVASTYRIQNAVAFLQSTDKFYENDQTYRPTYRQVPACILNGGYSIDVELDRPSEGEKLVLYLQVTHSDPNTAVTADNCFTRHLMEVRQ